MIRPETLIGLAALHPDPSSKTLKGLSVSSLYGAGDDFSEEDQQAVKDFRAAARSCYSKLSKKAKSKLVEVGDLIFGSADDEADAEKVHEEEMEAMGSFWEAATKASVSADSLESAYNLKAGNWLGNGKWGWVMMAPKKGSDKQAVLKLSDVHHADVNAKEWVYGSKMGKGHENIVRYEEVFLYADDNGVLKKCLLDGYAAGKLKSDIQRKSFPTHYVCMTIEKMNAGSVQHWLDKELLSPEGMMVILQEIAAALAYMHENGITHNDMKPENIFLHSKGRYIHSKLGDLGLAQKSKNRTSDVTRYGMTGFCMATGEHYGTRHYSKDKVSTFVSEVEACVSGCGLTGKLGNALQDLPRLLDQVLSEKATMKQVRDWRSIQGFQFPDDSSSGLTRSSSETFVGSKVPEESSAASGGYNSRITERRTSVEKSRSSVDLTARARKKIDIDTEWSPRASLSNGLPMKESPAKRAQRRLSRWDD